MKTLRLRLITREILRVHPDGLTSSQLRPLIAMASRHGTTHHALSNVLGKYGEFFKNGYQYRGRASSGNSGLMEEALLWCLDEAVAEANPIPISVNIGTLSACSVCSCTHWVRRTSGTKADMCARCYLEWRSVQRGGV